MSKRPKLRLIPTGDAAAPAKPPASAPLVLVVDDYRSFTQGMARYPCPRHGRPCMRWVEASDGVEALEILNHSDERFAFVVADNFMPWMTGAELLDRVAERWPETGRLLVSNWSTPEQAMGGRHEAIDKDVGIGRLVELVCRRARRQP